MLEQHAKTAAAADEICHKASQLAGFTLADGSSVGLEQARCRLTQWSANFEAFGIAAHLTARLIRDIRFLGDQEIINNSLHFLRESLPESAPAIFCSFGDESESSTRIMRLLNATNRFHTRLGDALNAVGDSMAADSAPIVFIDDFLNTGGQFCRIIDSWFEQQVLTVKQQRMLARCRLRFLFAMGKEEGRLAAQAALTRHGLHGSVHILEQYPRTCCFGDADDLIAIQRRYNRPLAHGSFAGIAASEVTDLFQLCQAAGTEMLRAGKAQWPLSKVEQRCLGYGNEGKLIIGQNNMPTCTLTCLWAAGEVNHKGQRIEWQPLFKRRSKERGIEALPGGHSHCGTAGAQLVLDPDTGRCSAPPLEIILLWETAGGDYSSLRPTPNASVLQRYLPTELHARIAGGAAPLMRIYRLPAGQYAELNNHLSVIGDGDQRCRAFIKHADLIETPASGFAAIRIQIHARGMSVTNAIRIIHRSRVEPGNTHGKGLFLRHRGNQRAAMADSARSLVQQILRRNLPGAEATPRDPRLMVFLRLTADSFTAPAFTSVAARIATLRNLNQCAKHTVPEPIALELQQARLTLNERGTLMLCAASLPVNRNWLQDEFASVYYEQELLVAAWAAAAAKAAAEADQLQQLLLRMTTAAAQTNSQIRYHLQQLSTLKGMSAL